MRPVERAELRYIRVIDDHPLLSEALLLRVFCEVATRQSFSDAAEALNYTQPAVSQQIARLERQIGGKLIERDAHRLRLTPAGRILLRHAQKVLMQMAEAEGELATAMGRGSGAMRVGAYPSVAGTILPSALSTFRAAMPSIGVTIQVAEPPELIAAVRRDDCDLAIVDDGGFCGPLNLSGLLVDHLLDDPLHAVLPTDHPLTAASDVTLSDLRDENWLVLAMAGVGDGDSNIVIRACQEAGFQPRVVFTSLEFFAIGGMVASGMGISVVPALAVSTLGSDVSIRPLRGHALTRRISAISVAGPSVGMISTMLAALHTAIGQRHRTAEVAAWTPLTPAQ